MKRRSFLKAAFSAAMVGILSRLPGSKYGAVFQVVRVVDDGGPRDYEVPVGTYVYNGHRCCKNCQLVFAAFTPGGDWEKGPSFSDCELRPVNRQAHEILADIEAVKRLHSAKFYSAA